MHREARAKTSLESLLRFCGGLRGLSVIYQPTKELGVPEAFSGIGAGSQKRSSRNPVPKLMTLSFLKCLVPMNIGYIWKSLMVGEYRAMMLPQNPKSAFGNGLSGKPDLNSRAFVVPLQRETV